MSEYVLDHHQEGERQRLALMSRLPDPLHRRHLERPGVGPGARTLEVGCGNGSVSAWLAGRITPDGHAVAVDLSRLGLEDVTATAETALYNGGSLWAQYWTQTVNELRPRLADSGKLDGKSIETFLAHCADTSWWTQTIAFTAAAGRTRA